MAVRSDLADDLSEMVGGCCVCSDERGWDENPLVYCDGQGCNVAVHQACYGIVTVPSGPWFCRKCESQERSARVRCELCPSRDGALKRTDSSGWAHVVCALYIPEVRFGNVTTMEPILISLIPQERFNKACYICEESSKGSKAAVGACMQCNKPGCKQNFHVTCAQMLGLLCEEAGNMMDNVKYCGYCQYHYSKLKKTSNMKIIPPFRPVPNSPHPNQGPDSGGVAGNNSKEISPDIGKVSSLKKKLSGSSSASNSSKGSVSSHHSSSSAMPRIAPSNLFASNSYSSLGKSSDRAEMSSSGEVVVPKPAEDSYVLKSDDLKSSGSGGDSKKFLKANDFMTVKLNDVLAASLDRPIHETPPRDKAQPPDIKPHVTLTPIPMRSSDKPQEKSSVLFGQQGSSMSKTKESPVLPPKLEAEGSLAEISPTLFSHDSKHSSSKRSRVSVDLESPTSTHPPAPELKPATSIDHGTPPNWDGPKQQSGSQRASSSDRAVLLTSGSTTGPVEEPPKIVEDQSSLPPKRGPGRPVKRRNSGPTRDEEEQKKKSKRGGRRGGNNSYNRSNDNGDPPFPDENSNDGSKKSNGSSRKSNPMPKRPDESTPTLSQLKAQKDAAKSESSSAVLPAHMFGNALNPASSMAQRMVDTLSQEMETMVAAGVVLGEKEDKPIDKLVGIPLPKYASSVLNGSSSGTPGTSTSSSSNPPQTLEQLLERQWEQGSQFLMEQAQHLDIAQLLSCLNQLKQDNRALEEHVSNLMQRKEQLIAINARLSIPLGSSLAVAGGPVGVDRGHDGPGLAPQPRSNPPDIPVIHPQQQSNGRPVNYSGHQVPVVMSSHPSPHINQGHSSR